MNTIDNGNRSMRREMITTVSMNNDIDNNISITLHLKMKRHVSINMNTGHVQISTWISIVK